MKLMSQAVLLLASLMGAAQVAQAVSVSACYDVPVALTLWKYASFPVERASIDMQTEDGQVSIHYRLPDDIVGMGGRHIHLTGKAPADEQNFFAVTETATGTVGQCVRSSTNVTCMLHYAELNVDVPATEQFLREKYRGDLDLSKRVQVMKAFGGDAVGILKLDLTEQAPQQGIPLK
jgi:hypothetical protein